MFAAQRQEAHATQVHQLVERKSRAASNCNPRYNTTMKMSNLRHVTRRCWRVPRPSSWAGSLMPGGESSHPKNSVSPQWPIDGALMLRYSAR